MLKRLTAYFQKYERHIGIATLVCGFAFDNWFLIQPDNLRDNISFLIFLGVSSFSILLTHIFKKGIGYSLSLFVMQFALGGLFSMSLVFYARGATFEASWPFLLTLFAYLVGNELLKKHYILAATQIGAFFIALFSYLIFIAPVLLHQMNEYIFLLSGAVSLIFITLFISILYFVDKVEIRKSFKALLITIPTIYLFITLFYFTNLIPPIPLLLKDSGVYHSLLKVGGDYRVTAEEKDAFSFFKPQIIHVVGNESVYVFSSVYAPVALSANISHVWQYYDEAQKKWITKSTINIPVIGGREKGYRMYSTLSSLREGSWRIDVKTSRGQIIGRIKFKVEKVSAEPQLVTEIK